MKKYLLLLFVISIGFVFRFIHLGNVPVGLHQDEALFGYNAYSILMTGKDMSGNFLPLHLQSFLYAPAGYSYLSIPFIYIFGLSAFSVRLVSAFFGSLTILFFYWFVSNLLAILSKETTYKYHSNTIALLSSFMFAVSPWHINLSRTATENTVTTFFIILALSVFIEYVKRKKFIYLLFCYLSFFVTLYIYHGALSFLSLFIPFFVVLFSKKLKYNPGIKLNVLFYLSLIVIPVFSILKSPAYSERIRSLSIFNFPQTQITVNDWISTDGVTHVPYVFTRLFHNKISGYSLTFAENLGNHFSFSFLFSDKGLPDRYRTPSVGLLYPFESILILIGVVRLFNVQLSLAIFLIGWIIIAFSGSALTFHDVPNLQRTVMAVPAFSMLSGIGAFELVRIVKKVKYSFIWLFIFCMIILYSTGFYLLQYYSYGKMYRPWYRQDGYKALVSEVSAMIHTVSKVVITTREGCPAIFFLFYSKYDPKAFQNETENVTITDLDRIKFSKYEFTTEECPVRINSKTNQLTAIPEYLYINSALCNDIPAGARLLKELYRVDGSKVFQLLMAD